MRCFSAWVCLSTIALLSAQQSRLGTKIDPSRAVLLRGNVRGEARPEFDQGRLEPSFIIPSVTVHLGPSAAQQSALERLLSEQQDPTSTNYHKWLTPEEYADRFGTSPEDLQKITEWAQAQGFKILHVARGRHWITFSGSAEQLTTAFRVDLHRYTVQGVAHFANANEPSIPVALANVVSRIRGLDDFKLKPRFIRNRPEFNLEGTHFLAPDDFATIYDAAKLYQAGIDGSGQSLAIVGQTDIKMADINQFRNQFALAAINLQQVLVPGQTDPGVSTGDLPEADLDVEWSGAVARNAKIIYVYSGDVVTSLTYAVDQNLAPVISMSYGNCEASNLVDLPTLRQIAQQANAQGIT